MPFHRTTPSFQRVTKNHAGFTIVELLIVVVVIAILAAITVIAYNGIKGRAVDSSMKSDLQMAASVLENDKTLNSSYPLDAASANGGQGLKSSGSNVLTYELKSYGYCVTVANTQSGSTYRIRSDTNTIETGLCTPQVTTLAGGSQGYADATGTSAQFNSPWSVALDSSGNTYVSDTSNHRIRKITPGGVVSTFAGSGVAGFNDATGTAAQFNNPRGIAIDSSGTLYVADGANHRIRKITPGGVVSTFAGSGVAGFNDATGTAAQFNLPTGLTVDSSGVVYLVEANNNRIRKITTGGAVSTFAGMGASGTLDGTGTSAMFNIPTGITVDSSGTLYVADMMNNRIRKITSGAVVTTLAGSTSGFADGTGAAALFNMPSEITVASNGTIYVSDQSNHKIRAITQAGVVTTIAGSTGGFANGSGTTAQFNNPRGLALDSSGIIYISDSGNHRIRKIAQ